MPPPTAARAILALAGTLLASCGADEGARNGRDSPGAVPTRADVECLRFLGAKGVGYLAAPPTRGVRTPVEITGPVAGVRLAPRARRAPIMDCELARALYE